VPSSGVVAEAMTALIIADALLEKFGGDSLAEVRRNISGYLEAIPAHLATNPELVDPDTVTGDVDETPMGDSVSEWRV
jgi:chorismate synthase